MLVQSTRVNRRESNNKPRPIFSHSTTLPAFKIESQLNSWRYNNHTPVWNRRPHFALHFVATRNLTGPIVGLHFMGHNSVFIDTTHGLIHLPHLANASQKQCEGSKCQTPTSAYPWKHNSTTNDKKKTTDFADHPSERHTAGTVTPVGKLTEAVSLLICYSISTTKDQNTAVEITNTTESPFSIKKNTQIAEISVVTPEQIKFIKPVDTAILSMIPEGHLDQTNYLSK